VVFAKEGNDPAIAQQTNRHDSSTPPLMLSGNQALHLVKTQIHSAHQR
jgi:hypothetical protein